MESEGLGVKINQQVIQERADDLATLLIGKKADYGNSFEQQFNKRGLLGVLIRLEDKISRLDNLQSKDAQVSESISDTLLDIAGYALLASVLVGENNG